MEYRWNCPNRRHIKSPQTTRECMSCKKNYLPNSGTQKVCVNCRDSWYLNKIKTWQFENKQKVLASKRKSARKAYQKNPKRAVNYAISYYNKRKAVDPLYYQSKLARQRAWWKYLRKNSNAICKNCSKAKQEIRIETHHIDKNPFNNIPENIMLLCVTCHKNIHLGIHTPYSTPL